MPVAGRAGAAVPDLEAELGPKGIRVHAISPSPLAGAAGIAWWARVPIVLTSRADFVRARMASCAVAVLYVDARRRAAVVPAV